MDISQYGCMYITIQKKSNRILNTFQMLHYVNTKPLDSLRIWCFAVAGGLLLGHLGKLSSQGGKVHPRKCGWQSLHPSYLQVNQDKINEEKWEQWTHLQLCRAWRCKIFNQISGHMDGPGERLWARRVQKSHWPEEDLASFEGEYSTTKKNTKILQKTWPHLKVKHRQCQNKGLG